MLCMETKHNHTAILAIILVLNTSDDSQMAAKMEGKEKEMPMGQQHGMDHEVEAASPISSKLHEQASGIWFGCKTSPNYTAILMMIHTSDDSQTAAKIDGRPEHVPRGQQHGMDHEVKAAAPISFQFAEAGKWSSKQPSWQ